MKKYLLSAFAVAVGAFMGMAQSTKPGAGLLNMEEDNAGLGNIEVLGGCYEINPECTAMAQLYQNGVLLRQVPSYAGGGDVYVFEGFTTSNQDKTLTVGDLHITFYRGQSLESGNPACQFGSYKVIIPEGYTYTVSGGQKTLTPRIEREFFINVPSLSIFPKSGAVMEKITSIYVTMPEQAKNVTCQQIAVKEDIMDDDNNVVESRNFSAYAYVTLPDAAETMICATAAKVSGTIIEYQFPAYATCYGNAKLTIPAGAISFKVTGGQLEGSYSNAESSARYTLADPNIGKSDVEPAPGIYEGGFDSKKDITNTNTQQKDFYYYFTYTAPENIPSIYMANGAAELYKLNDDGSRGEMVASFALSKTGVNKVSMYSKDPSLYRVASTLYPGPGKYQLVVPAGKIWYTMTNKNAELTFGPYEFTAPAGADDDFTVSPSTTGKIEYIKEIEITFPEEKELAWNLVEKATLSNEYTTITLAPNNLGERVEGTARYYIDGNVVKFELPVKLMNPGEWNFSIKGDALLVDGKYTTINKTFTIQMPARPELVIKPNVATASIKAEYDEDYEMDVYFCDAATLEDEVEFTIEIPNGFTSMFWKKYGSMAGYDEPTYRRQPISDALAAGMTEGTTIPVENGEKSTMYEVAFSVGEDIPDDARFLLIMTVDDNVDDWVGIQLIKANELVDVYSITGARVASKVDSSILTQLPAGLYIINGKKVLVK